MSEVLTVNEKNEPSDKAYRLKPIQYTINEGGCWECVSHSGNKGYPVFTRNKKRDYLSRYMFEMFVEPIIDNNVILHSCDNPKCINPQHLSQGTKPDNVADMVSKGRQSKGMTHNRKLSLDEVIEIKKLIIEGKYSEETIGNMFGVRQSSIHKIKIGHSYKYVEVD
jgi:hypothetical protein